MGKRRQVISHYDFVRDLGRGAKGEAIVEAFFKKEFGLIAKNVSEKNPDYDMILDEVDPHLAGQPKVVPKKLLKKIFKDSFGYSKKTQLTVEVKFDEAAAKYGNFFFEALFDAEAGNPGGIFKCKADLFVWLVPNKGRNYKVYVFRRAEMLAWLFDYVMGHQKTLEYKTPAISPYTRGLAIPIKEAVKGFGCLDVFDFTI